MPVVPFVGPSYQMDARSFDVQRTINYYPLVSEVQTSKSVTALRQCPGLSLYATAGTGPCRGGISSTANRLFFVSGSGFYEVFTDGSTTLHGSLNTFNNQVSLAENSTQIIVVDGVDGWIFTKATNAWAQITDVNFPEAAVISYQDGYFLTFDAGTQDFYISAINDGTSWDALDFTQVQSSPDALVSLISDNGNVWLFGNRSTEVYQNTGNAAFPFERIPGAIVQTGCAAAFTVQKFDNTVAWLGVDEQGQGVVWKAEGYQARRISTQAIEKRISESGSFTDAFAWVYHQQGHIFYVLSLVGAETSLVYDGATGQWHERAFFNQDDNALETHRGLAHFFFGGKNLVIDRQNGNIYELSLDAYSDNGTPMVRERTSPHYDGEKALIPYASFELDMEVGVGLVTGQGEDPQIMMQYSDDGGYTWSNEIWRAIGKIGKYNTRVIWRKLGMSRDRVFRVRVTDPVFVQINEAYVNGT
jgi:hypothetical protein